MSGAPVLQALLRGRMPNQRKNSLYFVEASTTQVHIYEGSQDGTQSKKRHLRSLMIDNSDIVGERRSKWYQREGFRFYFQRADGRYIFKCNNAEQRSQWIKHLQQAIKGELHRTVARSLSPPPPLPPPMWPSDTPISTVLLDQHQTEERSGYEESDWNSLVQYKWFWGYMSRGDCEIKLYNEGKIGDFVIRINSNGQLIMSLWRQDGVQHHIIVRREDIFQFKNSTGQASGTTLVDMLKMYITVCKGTISPIGESLFVTDLNHGWKKRKMSIAVESGVNRYNLVQLHSSPKHGQRFQIADSGIKPKAKARKPPPLVKSASCHGERDLTVSRTNAPSTLPKVTRARQPVPAPAQSPLSTGICSSENVPEYVNARCKQPAGDNESNASSEEYENWPAIAQHEDDREMNGHQYINWNQKGSV